MLIFVSESVSSGSLAATPLPTSLLREGGAMLAAVSTDLAAVPECRVVTTLDRRLNDSILADALGRIEIDSISTADAERAAFKRWVKQADATLVIAPETDGILASRVQQVLDLGGVSLNCLPAAIELCGDKLRLARHFAEHGIRTVPTRPLSVEERVQPFDIEQAHVIKPRDGAGSWLTFGIRRGDRQAWDNALTEFAAAKATGRAILQPWIDGQSISVGCLCEADGQIEVLPIACQNLSGDRFQYQGGQIPADIPDVTREAIVELVRTTCSSIQGLRGYIGIDLIVTHADPQSPMIMEINPRLTTSYAGYRQLCLDNLAERMFRGQPAPLRWKSATVHFLSDGTPHPSA